MDEQHQGCRHHPSKKFLAIILAIILILVGVYVISLTRNSLRTYDYIGKTPEPKNQITVNGEGKVTAAPDVAVITMGIVSDGTTVAAAQKQNNDKMNNIIAAVKNQFSIPAKDIQTQNYSVYPKYNYQNGRQSIIGYTVNQNVVVKVRDFDKTGAIIGKATELGANQISGPSFSIDDIEAYKAQAREIAIKQAKDNAKVLADQVGIGLGRIVNFSEGGAMPITPMYADLAVSLNAETKAVPAPQIEAGSQDVIIDVSISYEIK